MRTIFVITILSFVVLNEAYTQETDGNAMVVSVTGDAECISSKNVKLKIGSILVPNDSIYMSKNVTVTLLEEDGRLNSYSRSFRLHRKLKQNAMLQKLIRQSLQSQSWLESAKKNLRNNFRSGATEEINMVYPRNTRLRKPPEQLTWTFSSKSGTEFEVSIRCYENDFSYDQMTKNTNLSLSSNVSIAVNIQYYWFVRDVFSELSEIPSAVWFYVLDPKELEKFELERQTIVSIMNNDTLSAAYQLLYANLLMSYELYAECKSVLDVLAKKDAHNQLVHTFYAIIFDKMDMMNDSRKHIEYTDQYGD